MKIRRNTLLGCIVLLAMISLAVVIAAPAQNVPANAREAAALPQFAQRLAHHGTASHRALVRGRARSCSALQGSGLRRTLPLDGVFYANGPSNGLCDIQNCDVDAWTVNFGFSVTDTIGSGGNVNSFNLAFWLLPGDTVQSVDWALGTSAFGSNLGYGTASVSDQFLFTNTYGYDIHQITITGLNVAVSTGDWLTLQNAVVNTGDPAYWDENAGPSQAETNGVGTIPSESFNVSGNGDSCMPERQGSFKVIHDFTGNGDGGSPSGVVIDRAGNLYGPTQPYGGTGTVYKMAQAGSGWVLDNLYTFAGGNNGGTPGGVMVGHSGILYGAASGGIENCTSGGYCGLIFGLRPSPTACVTASCSWTENVLYRFTGSTDAWQGSGLVSDQAGNLYGVSESGGAQQKGAVFELTPSGGVWVESILYSFTGGSDGGTPTDIIVGNDGNLYGMAALGGAYGGGVVFQLTPSGSGWTEAVLYDLPSSPLGTNPHSLLQDSAGNLFGTFDYAGCCASSVGLIFMLSPSNGNWVFNELHHGNANLDGDDLFPNMTLDEAGNLHGTEVAYSGCINTVNYGYIFELARGSNGWQYSTPVAWDNTYFGTGGALALDAHGNLYGTTSDCGAYNHGTVWEFTGTQ